MTDARPPPHPWLVPTVTALVALALRVPLAFVADDQFGDAPVRLEILRRFVAHPGLYWDFSHVNQYGPLPTQLTGLVALAGVGPLVASRVVVVAGGVLSVALVARLAQRFTGSRGALAAGLALALSPLHLQASTTFASETIYLAFALGTILAALDDAPLLAIVCAFGASTTRYDAWLWLPVLAGWWAWKEFRGRRARGLAVAALLLLGPASILLANGLSSGHPFAPLTFIADEHVRLAARAEAQYGRLSWRVSMLGYWPAALFGLLTPGFAIALFPGLVRALKWRSRALLPLSLGLLPPLLYTGKSVLLGSFWPMARFALGPATLLLAAMPALRTRTLVVCVMLALATDAALVYEGDGSPGLGLAAAASSPLSRLPADLRAGAQALRHFEGPAALDKVPTYEDIVVSCASRRDRYLLEHVPPNVVPGLVVSLSGGALDGELRASGEAFGHRYARTRAIGRVTLWRLAPAP